MNISPTPWTFDGEFLRDSRGKIIAEPVNADDGNVMAGAQGMYEALKLYTSSLPCEDTECSEFYFVAMKALSKVEGDAKW